MPENKGLYKVQVDHRNAFWSYEYQGDCSVITKWGRIGTSGQSQTKDYGSSSRRDREISKLISEKINKGYKPETEESLQKETAVAEALGSQSKIQNLYFVAARNNNEFVLRKDYDSDQGLIVEVLQSWTKEVEHYYLTPTSSFQLIGAEAKSNAMQTTGSVLLRSNTRIRAIRQFLKGTALATAKIITQRFGQVTRKLMLGGEQDENQIQEVAMVLQQQNVGGGGIGAQALISFAALGDRVLVL